jgi:hypothetical protein
LVIITLMQAFKCTRCGHEWFPRKFDEQGRPVRPQKCANKLCATPYWDRERMTDDQKADLVRRQTKRWWRDEKAQAGRRRRRMARLKAAAPDRKS